MPIVLICIAALVHTDDAAAQTTAYQRCYLETVSTVAIPTDAERQAEKARIDKMKQEDKG